MNRILLPILALFMLLDAPRAGAQTPPASLIPGTMFGNGVYDSVDNVDCQIAGPAISFFKRNGSGNAKIGFPPVTYDVQGSSATTYYLGGLARLKFATPTSGTIVFYTGLSNSTTPAAIAQPAFTGYAQNWDAATNTLTVQFDIQFPEPQGAAQAFLTVPVSAVYHE